MLSGDAPQRGELRRAAGEYRPDVVVASQAFLFYPDIALLIAIVDRGDAADGHEDGQRQYGSVGAHPGSDARDVMIPHEGIGQERVEELVMTPESMVQFEEIAVIDA